MQLVGPLACGIAGAASGRAEIYQRGTASRSGYYDNAEGTGGASTDDVALDSNGGAEVYVNEYVDVQVYDAATGGNLVREFTVMGADRNTEVISQSFTGQAYAGGGSAPSLPVDLQTVLDLWYTSAGALDFRVDVDGTATNLSTAVSAGYGALFSVKAYGAVGDGVNDDRSAILAAKTAADAYGGVVFFPAGTYQFESSINWDDTSIVATPGEAILRSNDIAVAITFRSANERKFVVHGMVFEASVYASDSQGAADITFRSCRFVPDDTNASDCFGILGTTTNPIFASFEDCYFLHTTDEHWIIASSMSQGRIRASGCRFVSPPIGNVTGVSGIRGYLLTVEGCVFDISAMAQSTSFHYLLNLTDGVADVVIVGNRFIESTTSLVTHPVAIYFDWDAGMRLVESGNIWPAQDATEFQIYAYFPDLDNDELDDVQVMLEGRVGRTYYESGSLSGTESPPFRDYGTAYYVQTGAGAVTFDMDNTPAPPGARSVLIIENTSGGESGNIALSGVDGGNDTTHTIANGNRSMYIVEYMGNNGVFVHGIEDV